MSIKIAINGFGRIGRMVYRIAYDRKDIEIVAINDITNTEILAHLLAFDTVHGKFPHEISSNQNEIKVNNKNIQVFSERNPENLPWKKLGIDIVVESTGLFTSKEFAQSHINAGAKKVIISAPAKNEDITLVMGVNQEQYNSTKHDIISIGSCTTNALAPLLKVLEDNFGVKSGFINTIHSYTNDQKLLDLPHTDLRRARAAAQNIIPTTTGAAKTIYKVIPNMKNKIDGLSIRVPTKDVSIIDLTAILNENASVDELNHAFKIASETNLKGILSYQTKPLVSNDYIGNTYSSIYDSLLTQVIDGNNIKVLSWYDNEYGFSARLVDIIEFISKNN